MCILGEIICPLVEKELKTRNFQCLAPKITGMLTDLRVTTVEEVIELVYDHNKLEREIKRAENILLPCLYQEN